MSDRRARKIGSALDATPLTATIILSNGVTFEVDERAATIAGLVGVYAALIKRPGWGQIRFPFQGQRVETWVDESLPPSNKVPELRT